MMHIRRAACVGFGRIGARGQVRCRRGGPEGGPEHQQVPLRIRRRHRITHLQQLTHPIPQPSTNHAYV